MADRDDKAYRANRANRADRANEADKANKADTGDVLYRSGEERTVERVPDIVVSHLYEDAVKDTRDRTMLGALVRTWSKDGRIRFKNKFAESWFDYTRSVKALQDAIAKATGRKVEWFEDVWKSLNAKSSIDEREQEVMSRTLAVPLSRHISSMVSLSGGKYDLDSIEAYLNAKHGLERNELMARRAAEEAAEEAYGAEIAKCRKALAADALDTTAEERLEELTSQYDAMVKEAYAANRNMVEVLNQPDGILYGVDKKDGRKLFFFLKDAGNGLYATSVTFSGESHSSNAKIPTFFENSKIEEIYFQFFISTGS